MLAYTEDTRGKDMMSSRIAKEAMDTPIEGVVVMCGLPSTKVCLYSAFTISFELVFAC